MVLAYRPKITILRVSPSAWKQDGFTKRNLNE